VVTARTEQVLYATGEVCGGRVAERHSVSQQFTREGRNWHTQMADGLVVPMKPGNAGGGKKP